MRGGLPNDAKTHGKTNHGSSDSCDHGSDNATATEHGSLRDRYAG